VDANKYRFELDAISSNSFIAINKTLIRVFGLEVAVFISNLADKMRYFLDKGMLGNDGSFFLRHADQEEQTGLSEYKLKQCKKILKDIGVIDTVTKGMPAKEYYILHLDVLAEYYLAGDNAGIKEALDNKTPKNDGVKTPKNHTVKTPQNRGVKTLRNRGGFPYNKENKDKDNKGKENKVKETVPLGTVSAPDKSGASKNQPPPCPHQQIIDLYHRILPELPSVRTWPEHLRKRLRSRWRESEERQNIGWWENYFEKVREAPWLMGQVSDFHADLEWLIGPKNLCKVLNGRYSRRDNYVRKFSEKTDRSIKTLKQWMEKTGLDEEDRQ